MKILPLEQLVKKVRELRAEGKSIVHCHGVFDLLHIGHIRYFQQSRKYGDVLIVTVTQDQYVDKGPDRPAFSHDLRVEGVASLDCVDFVAINEWATAEETLKLLRPDYYVKGAEFKNLADDMTGKIGREAEVVREVGAQLVFADDIVFSSSNLINRYLSTFSDETQEYLNIFRDRYSIEEIFAVIEKMADLNVLVIGDTIIDEYQYCRAIGVSSKDPALAVKYESNDLFAGGALAVANHVANFAGKVQLVSILGEFDRHERLIRSHMEPNVSPFFVTKPKAPTTLKRRFLDGYSFNKLFEVYVMDDSSLPEDDENQLCDWLKEQLPKYDLVIAADFGHGAISEKMVKILCDYSPFLAVNTQANAGNRGFHTINRYPKADFVSLAGHELNLACQNKNINERVAIEEVANRMGCEKFVVTLGRRGCLVWEPCNNSVVPAFAQDVVDRVGAGDTFFSVTAMAAYLKVPSEILGFLGNIVGAEAVRIIGNQKPINKMRIKKHITAILK